MDPNEQIAAKPIRERRFGCLPVLALVLGAVVVTAILTVWAVKANIFAREFQPITLNAKEGADLDGKIEKLESLEASRGSGHVGPNGTLEPEAYSEEGASRRIAFTEKELNALLAKNTDLARKLAIDLSDDLVSAKVLMPVDEDFPVLGGQLIRVKAGLGLIYEHGNPEVLIRGISIMGVPLPNAWLGGIKNIDLVKEYGGEQGFWKDFAAGIDNIRVEDGSLVMDLKE